MNVLYFDIIHPGGTRQPVVVESERAIIGSGGHADVPLPKDQAAYEHVLIEVIGQRIRAKALSHDRPATVNGMPFTDSSIEPNTVLGIGAIQMFVRLQVADGTHQRSGADKKKKESSPIIRLVGLIAMPILGFIAFMDDDPPLPAPPAEAPALFASAAAACPEAAPHSALAFASEKMDIAEGKRERHPFAPSEGVAAVELYRLAAACFRSARQEESAKEAEQTSAQLRDSIVADFRARRLRLEHMMAVKDYELVRKDVNTLTALTAGKQGPYVNWLAKISADLKRKGQ